MRKSEAFREVYFIIKINTKNSENNIYSALYTNIFPSMEITAAPATSIIAFSASGVIVT